MDSECLTSGPIHPLLFQDLFLKQIVDEFSFSFHEIYKSLSLVNLINHGDFPRKMRMFDGF